MFGVCASICKLDKRKIFHGFHPLPASKLNTRIELADFPLKNGRLHNRAIAGEHADEHGRMIDLRAIISHGFGVGVGVGANRANTKTCKC